MTLISEVYSLLLNHFGEQKWWPADSKDEIIIGAILTQNTNWNNVEKAIYNLKKEGVCSLSKIAKLDLEKLAQLIRPCGFYNVKSVRLQEVAKRLMKWSPEANDIDKSRNFLLSIKGIGEETADSILLYAYNIPVFVIDSYTKRLWSRLTGTNRLESYKYYQTLFTNELPQDVKIYNTYHALIVTQAKEFCRKKPVCNGCPLLARCSYFTTFPHTNTILASK